MKGRGCVALCALTGLFAPSSARAQAYVPGMPGTEVGPQGPSRLTQDPNRPDDGRARPTLDRSSRLFDLSSTVSALQIDLGPIWYRPQAAKLEGFERGTGELAIGTVTTAPWKPFYLAGHHKLVFRAFDSKSYHFSLGSDMATGVALGPLELESRIGLNVINIGAFHGDWSGELLSPRVSAAAAVHVWRFRVDIQAHSEYLWRWFGNDYLVRGVTLGLRLDVPRMEPPVTKKSSDR